MPASNNVRRLLTQRKFLSGRRRKAVRWWTRANLFLRHPATLLVLGFVLTAVVGAEIQRRQQESEKYRSSVYEANAAMLLISQALSEYTFRLYLARRAQEKTLPVDGLMTKADEALAATNSVVTVQTYIIARPFSKLTGAAIADSLQQYLGFLKSDNEVESRDLTVVYKHELWGKDLSDSRSVFELGIFEVTDCLDRVLRPIRAALDESDPKSREKIFASAVIAERQNEGNRACPSRKAP